MVVWYMGANPGWATGAIAPQEFVRVGYTLPQPPKKIIK